MWAAFVLHYCCCRQRCSHRRVAHWGGFPVLHARRRLLAGWPKGRCCARQNLVTYTCLFVGRPRNIERFSHPVKHPDTGCCQQVADSWLPMVRMALAHCCTLLCGCWALAFDISASKREWWNALREARTLQLRRPGSRRGLARGHGRCGQQWLALHAKALRSTRPGAGFSMCGDGRSTRHTSATMDGSAQEPRGWLGDAAKATTWYRSLGSCQDSHAAGTWCGQPWSFSSGV
mmetsp:Transcript_13544/g.38487  ORF Transcript_13544/g.38487 Transcript_13544/m.38487 type:complete len:232 (+) Transcript_13544:1306-2001(+)